MEKVYARNDELTDNRSLSSKPVPAQNAGKILAGEDFFRMTPAEHLDEARRALADGYTLDANPVKSTWGRVRDARKHLEEIRPTCPQYKAARKLLRETLVRERLIDNICLNIANQIMIRQREMLARELAQYYKGRGLYVDIELSGPDKTFMKLASPVFRETTVDRIIDETNFLTYLKEAGFSKVVMSDDDENVWTYNPGKLRRRDETDERD